jgi:hypothetical protein
MLAVACNNSKKQVETLQKETEDLHDVAMKDLAEMNRVAAQLKDFLIAATMTPDQSATYTDLLTTMGNVENEMMAWMANYKAPTDMPAADALKYLENQKNLIEQNHIAILAATEQGKKLLPE